MEFLIMLILSRRESESVYLGDDIILTIVRVSGEKVRIGIQAPPHIKVLRNELEIQDAGTVKVPVKAKQVDPSSRSTPLKVRRAA